ncbi:hypothetical protein SAMN05216387_102178 [Nitrosovibrio tenuis]|uniref:Uncharacterized protein n=1 Tax=Nitrosovibrio tenuis TaxID=1233 RepID=A0A1H7IHS3_9PROT|nr:hypothetical protein SAMN05216387_102178 [Nitrosovibrio tenuis]
MKIYSLLGAGLIAPAFAAFVECATWMTRKMRRTAAEH